MPTIQTHSLRRSSADRFWCYSDVKHANASFSGDDDGSKTSDKSDNHDIDRMVVLDMPPAHPQLLSSDDASTEVLKGENHTLEASWWLLDVLGEDVATPPDLVRVPSGASLDYSDVDDSSAGTAADDGADGSSRTRGVSFAPTVTVRPIPHAADLSPAQRGQMFATSAEIRWNKARNRREFLYDGRDWRTATEEPDMDVCLLTGEAVHPVHSYH